MRYDSDDIDEDLINSLIDEYDCKFCIGGDDCVKGYKCDINFLNEKCPHYKE